MDIRNVYTSIACNRNTECADWGHNGLIVFGACNAVGILDPQYSKSSAKILYTFVHHTRKVNTVRWLRDNSGTETHFLSGADDGLAVLWTYDANNKNTEPEKYPLVGHENGVNAVAGRQRPNGGDWILATASADATVKIWSFDGAKCLNTQTVELYNGFGFNLSFAQVPNSQQIMLALSTDDETVSLMTEQQDKESGELKFKAVHRLIGHEDWVRGLDFVTEGDDLLLATSAQDCFIRLWRLSMRSSDQVRDNSVDIFNLMTNFENDIRVEEQIVQIDEGSWCAISLESVLYGHEGWVYSVQWHRTEENGLRLLSASIDKTLIIWEQSEDGVWLEKVRVGEVGGNSLGFYGGKFSKDGKSIMGHSYQGGFHIWNQSEENDSIWTPNVIIGGHFGEVRDLSWEPEGEFLMTVSSDQTTRIHSPWKRPNVRPEEITWHELARPQVHGYDMQALAILSRYKFASGAEEKIVRTFQAPANFIENFRRIAQVQSDDRGDSLLKTLPKGASVPSLGLSNKAVYNVDLPKNEEKHVKDEYPENYFVPLALDSPPQEETLMQNTLWPEVQKLYGHGYEIYALASSSDGSLLASSCRATTAEHAQIILWNTSTWKQIQKLPSHQLTVTQLRFSPDGRFLLSVSRDRRWSLFERQSTPPEGSLPSFTLAASSDKTNSIHGRIIWSCDWSHDGRFFATSSRDGKVVVWSYSKQAESSVEANSSLNGWYAVEVLELKNESITAVAFATKSIGEMGDVYILALGCESGLVAIYQFDGKFKLWRTLSKHQSHHLTVKRLQFRPTTRDAPNKFQLASCGEDHLVRVYEFDM